MPFMHPIKFSNFRSFIEETEIPFSKKITFLVGPNNSGKSNVLRFLSILFNNAHAHIDENLDFADSKNKTTKLSLFLDRKFVAARTSNRSVLQTHLRGNECDGFTLIGQMTKNGLAFQTNDEIFELIPRKYFDGRGGYLQDFSSSSSEASNVQSFVNSLEFGKEFKGTVYVPNVRFITQPGAAVPHFNRINLPGTTISFSNVITELGDMDRPNQNTRHLRSKLEGICSFIAYCLEKEKVSMQIPRDNSTILVNIDGNEHPLSNLGTGVEQLIIIGLASYIFPEKLILIDEPELHLHPRAQKRLMKYLNENIDSQFVIATHSAAILDSVDADVVRIENDGQKTIGQRIGTSSEKYRAVRDLGHSPSELIQTNFAVWVEGPSDRVYINHWIKLIDESLIEGVDYSIVFYGGRVLAQFSFADDGSDLVNAVSLSREFAVVIDSDKKTKESTINKTKLRVAEEIKALGGLCWITQGREMENYLSNAVIEKLAAEDSGITVPKDEFAQVLDSEKVKKVDFARRAIELASDEWPLDLNKQVAELVGRIRAAA
jgi:predicted ATPase